MAIARVGLGKAKITSSASSGEISRSALSTTKRVRLPSSHSTCRTFTEPRIIAVSSLIARARPDGQVQLHLLRFPPPSPPPPAPNTSRLARGQILPRGSDIAARVSEAYGALHAFSSGEGRPPHPSGGRDSPERRM